MKILFIGCVESSYRLLNGLLVNMDSVNIVGVITKESSGYNADFFDLRPLCEKRNILYCCVKNINDRDSLEFMKYVDADIAFCFGWSQLIKEEVINVFPKGIVGFHPAALPNNRGRHPLIWALALGLEETASTFFMINKEADEGDIISQKYVAIDYEDDARALYDKVMDAAVDQEIALVEAFEAGTVDRIPQLKGMGNSWRKRGRNDGEIDWRMSSRNIYNLVRSLTRPYVGAHFIFEGQEHKVWKASEIQTVGFENLEPGKVLAVNEDGTLDIKVGENGIRLLEFDRINVKRGDYVL